ncbi:DUF7524 family protein [Halobellus rubicundus]|uniref:Uncharacterized protein n=1 Tax=Halobellus rubicundus TaxID=2996466 RepID=A0ABD5MDM3_9EURY
MSESLRVELNEGAVHAIDAPDEATVRGPFHVVLHNAGGPVHVHLHLDDDLSGTARLNEANHYVEGGETSRIPIGVVPDRTPASGRLEIVSGYGAETAAIELTIANPDASDVDDAATQSDAEETQQRGTASATPSSSRLTRGGDRRSRTRRTSRARRSQRGTTFFDDSVPELLARVDADSPETLAFLGLAVVAVLVGLAVIAAVGEVVLSLVVAVIVTGAVAVAGWLLLE